MEPEIILITVFILSLFILKLAHNRYEFALSARTGMSAMLLVTALGHFLFAKGMSMIIPGFIPYPMVLVYVTGGIEIAAAIGLCLPKFRTITAWLLIMFFLLLLPANIYEAIKHVDIEKATFNGKGLSYLWYRIPLQLFFIAWVYLSSIKYRPAQEKLPVANKN